MNIKKKIFYAINLGAFLSGIVLLYFSKMKDQIIQSRMILSAILIAIAYVMFPFINVNKKDQLLLSGGIHLALIIGFLCGGYSALNHYLNGSYDNILTEILFALLLLAVISYFFYVVVSFGVSFYNISSKILRKLLQLDIKEKYTTTKKVIGALTAFIATLTTLAVSFTALIAALKNII